ncbi:MAG: (2Fe-2S) ferredoxin domain-containing protein [Alphaproteobacteria bacterium]
MDSDQSSPFSNNNSLYQYHVFCCTNRRAAGHQRGCCAEKNALALRDYMKKKVDLCAIPHTRINMAGCLDRCELGPIMVIYPEGTWYQYNSEADIDEIIEQHLIRGQKVSRLIVDNPT